MFKNSLFVKNCFVSFLPYLSSILPVVVFFDNELRRYFLLKLEASFHITRLKFDAKSVYKRRLP